MSWFRYAAPGSRPGDLGACCPELHETVTRRDGVVRLDARGIVHVIVGVDSRATLPMYHCPFCGFEVQSRRAVERMSRDGAP